MTSSTPANAIHDGAGLQARARIHGTGEMAELIRSKDWSRTALGPMEDWSETLIATINVLLLSPFSFSLYWGETKTLLYNDIYRPFLSKKHPAALGSQGPAIWKEAWPVIGPPIEAAFREGTVTNATETHIPILIDGTLQDRWWNYAFYPVYEGGRIAGVANPGSDETPRLRAKQALEEGRLLLRDNEHQLRIFVDSIPTLAWMANADGHIFWYNSRWYEYTGTTPEAMEGWGWQSVHDPAVLPSVMERWTDSIRTKKPFDMIFPLRGADGVMRPFLTRVAPVLDAADDVTQWFGTNTEIDELQRIRESLETSEAGLNQVLSATSDAVVSVNRNWILTYLNPSAEALYGPSRHLVGRNLWEAFPEAVYEGSPFVEHYNRAMNEGISGSFEAEYSGPLPITIGLEVYPSNSGIVTFSRDVTKLKQATAAAVQNEKLAAVGRLASSIAHEINNPLESVTNLLYLARHTSEPAIIDEYLESAERELRRVSIITNQTLSFYKQTTGRSSIDCADLFQETLSIYQGRLLNSGIQVEKRKRATRRAICLEGEIRQVLSNLIGNSIDAMPTGGRLILRSREAKNHQTGQKGIALTVADTGSGMSTSVRQRIFDAFFSTKGIGGTGLGLWLSKEIVDRHQGSLNVRSSERKTSHGTVFTLFLPFEIQSANAQILRNPSLHDTLYSENSPSLFIPSSKEPL